MKTIRWILLPLALMYGAVTFLRNKLYDWNILKSKAIPKKSIIVGNLSVGGTGKTPHVDYLIKHLIDQNFKVSTLSRGYGRSSRGPLIATDFSTADEIGDEPAQYKMRYRSKIEVVVAEKRMDGVELIQNNFPQNQVILLDDAYQHRAVKAGINILITPYDDLFTDDFMLPTGNLREWASGKKRADCVIVSKSPPNVSDEEKQSVFKNLQIKSKPIFFSSIAYSDLVEINGSDIKDIEQVLLVTGIGNPTPLVKYWEQKASVHHISFPDHHNFTANDIAAIYEKIGTFTSPNKAIITTEKDFMRLRTFSEVMKSKIAWYYQPITINIDNQLTFNKLIDEYVTEI